MTQCTRVVPVVGRTVVVVLGRVVVVVVRTVLEVTDVLVLGAVPPVGTVVAGAGSRVSIRPKFPHPPKVAASRIAPSLRRMVIENQ